MNDWMNYLQYVFLLHHKYDILLILCNRSMDHHHMGICRFPHSEHKGDYRFHLHYHRIKYKFLYYHISRMDPNRFRYIFHIHRYHKRNNLLYVLCSLLHRKFHTKVQLNHWYLKIGLWYHFPNSLHHKKYDLKLHSGPALFRRLQRYFLQCWRL